MPPANASDAVPVWPFLVALFVAAFALNWFWEMLQMPAYAEISERPLSEAALICTLAGVGDAVVTLGAYGLGALVARRRRWGMAGGWRAYTLMALFGAVCAVLIEWAALAAGRWSYSTQMLTVPLVKVGLLPFVQLALLTPAALWIATRWNERRARAGGIE